MKILQQPYGCLGTKPIAQTCKMYFVIPNCQGWPLGTTCAIVPKRLGKQICWSSMKVSTSQDAKPFEHKIWIVRAQVATLPPPWKPIMNQLAFWTHSTKIGLGPWCNIFDSIENNVIIGFLHNL